MTRFQALPCRTSLTTASILQAKAAIPALRETKGAVIFTSSGAAAHAYVSWGAYGTSKAAINSLAQHLAVEEPAICTVAVAPGRVDTDMQQEVRDLGRDNMSTEDYANFVKAFEEGRLNKPELPAQVIAELSVAATPELSGKHFRYDRQTDLEDF